MVLSTLPLAALAFTPALAATLPRRQDNAEKTATVDLTARRGSPAQLASGILYGIPDRPNQIPDSFYTDYGFNYGRAGGAQLEAGGWVQGLDQYRVRFESTRSNYETTRKYGAPFILLPHDIFGTDSVDPDTIWPGDNGDWTDYNNFLDQLTGDLVENNMLEGLIWDTWNEPDLPLFWDRSLEQYNELWVRTHEYLRGRPEFDGVDISGPSYTTGPKDNNEWWSSWLATVKESNTIPEQYSYHILNDPLDPTNDLAFLDGALKRYLNEAGLPPAALVNINEYGNQTEQNPTGTAWWIARLERYDAVGLRANWLSNCQLHDFFGKSLSKEGGEAATCEGEGYFPNGEYQVYKYYTLNMTGERVASESSNDDGILDVFTTRDEEKVRTLAGMRVQTGTWYVTIGGLEDAGLPAEGNLDIQTYAFINNGVFGEVDAPEDRGVFSHAYSNGEVTFAVNQPQEDFETAYAFEFAVGS